MSETLDYIERQIKEYEIKIERLSKDFDDKQAQVESLRLEIADFDKRIKELKKDREKLDG